MNMRTIKKFIKINEDFFIPLCIVLSLFAIYSILALIGGIHGKDMGTLAICFSIAGVLVLIRQLAFTPLKWH